MLHWQGERADAKVVPFPVTGAPAGRGSVDSLLDLMGSCMNFGRNAEIFGEDEPADYFYKVVTGAVRISKLMSDGRRQIGAFYLPGEIFGLETDEAHAFSAEAIGDSQVLVVKRSAFLSRATRDCAMVTEIWTQTMTHLQRARNHMLLLGRKNAQERIATFLLDMAERLSLSGEVELPMSRQDIADYLGLTIETVCRVLSDLKRTRLVAFPSLHQFQLADIERFRDLAECCD
jgi:CRP/FNR family nitrogen fixation transcriptional regulator